MSSKPIKASGAPKAKVDHRGSGPVAFFISLFIIALGSIQLVSTFHTYALNLSELNGLKRQESALVQKKQDLENDIARWDDKAYVTAQARERLGFVFPGEESINVKNPQAVTGHTTDDDAEKSSSQGVARTTLPWYKELAYAFKEADQPVATSGGASGKDAQSGQSQSGGSPTGGSGSSSSAGGQSTQQ